MRDAAGNVEATRQAARELAGAELGKVAQADKVDRLVHQRAAALAVVDVETAEIVDVLAHGELVEHRHLLRHHTDAALEVVAGGRHALAEQLDGALVVGEQLQDAVDGRGLARAVGAQQAKDLAGSDTQVKVVERNKVVVALERFSTWTMSVMRRPFCCLRPGTIASSQELTARTSELCHECGASRSLLTRPPRRVGGMSRLL